MAGQTLSFDPYDKTIDFNPMDPRLAVDPYPLYRQLRERAPVWLSPLGIWILTRYEDVVRLHADRSLRREYEATQTVRSGPAVVDQQYFQLFRHMMFVLDEPAHKRVRALVSRDFTMRRVIAQRDYLERLTNELIATAEPKREIELVSEYTSRLPKLVIGHLLGVPAEDRLMIGDWTDGLVPAFEFMPMSPEALREVNSRCRTLYNYFSDLADKRLRNPQDDLFTGMVHAAAEDDDRLTRDELISNAVLLYVAGQETTSGALGLALLNLHRHPDQLQLLKDDPDLIAAAIDELLRFDTPTATNLRVMPEPTTFSGVEIPRGSPVAGYLGAGFRDPEVFEQPDKLDLRRDLTGRKTAFGGGPWICLGQALAKAEMEIAIRTLLLRCPDLQLETHDPPYKPSPIVRGPQALHATW